MSVSCLQALDRVTALEESLELVNSGSENKQVPENLSVPF